MSVNKNQLADKIDFCTPEMVFTCKEAFRKPAVPSPSSSRSRLGDFHAKLLV